MGRILPLFIVIFIASIGYSIMITVFTPLFMHIHIYGTVLSSNIAIRLILLGFVLSLYPLGQLIGAPILVALSDRYGRKNILLASLFMTILSYLVIAFMLQIHHYYWLMLVLFIGGLSEGNVSIAACAIADLSLEKEHERFLSYIHVSSSGAFLFGPLLSGVLRPYGAGIPFWPVVILLILAISWVGIAFKETKAPSKGVPFIIRKSIGDVLHLFRVRRIQPFYIVNFLLYFAIFGFFRAYPMHLVDRFDLKTAPLSYYIAWVAVPIVAANLWLTTPLLKKFSSRTITIIAAFWTGTFMLLSALPSTQSFSLWAALFLTALGIGFCLPACPMMIAKASHHSEKSHALENNESLLLGAEASASLLGGFLAAIVVVLPMIAFGLIAIFAALLLVKSRVKRLIQ